MRPFGYHIAGGRILGRSLKAAVDAGFTSAQIFLGSPQTTQISPLADEEMRLFLDVKHMNNLKVFVHAPYVLHAFAKPENAKRNNQSLARFMRMCDLLDIDGFVLHMGGTKWYAPEDLLSMASQADSAQATWYAAAELFSLLKDFKTPVFLENCANGNELSGKLTVICDLLKDLRGENYNVGLCLDTCHAWAWGHNLNDFHTLKDMSDTITPYLKLIHLNSAPLKVTCGGKYDRHASLDQGVILKTSLATLLTWHPDIPVIVERDDYTDVLTDWAIVKEVDHVRPPGVSKV